MTPRRRNSGRSGWPILGGLAALAAVAGFGAVARDGATEVPQPMAFNHKRHIAEDLACADCHAGSSQGHRSGFPSVKQCMLCHKEAKGKHPDEPRVREYAKDGRQIPWVQVNRMVGHVYFSHVAHVVWAKMDCADCHGDMKKMEQVVTRPQVSHLDMRACMDCHREQGASLECVACHK